MPAPRSSEIWAVRKYGLVGMWTGSAVGQQDQGRVEQLRNAAAHLREPLPYGLALQVALVDALGDDGELLVGERDVPGQLGQVPAGPVGVFGRHLLGRQEAVVGA